MQSKYILELFEELTQNMELLHCNSLPYKPMNTINLKVMISFSRCTKERIREENLKRINIF